jgi:hypothetical protein
VKEQLVAYFIGEKRGAQILVVVAVISLAAAIALVAMRSRYRGMALPLAVIGLGELALGIGLWARTDAQVAALLDQLTRAPADMARAELARMGPVMRNFGIIKIVELVVLAGGVILAYTARSDFAFAAGTGCVAQASLLPIFDLFAERRAEYYVEMLRALAT